MSFVRRLLRKFGISQQPVVQNPVGNDYIFRKIKSIRYFGKEDVYCLDVPSTECFIANGMVVHNCLDATRYILKSHFFLNDSGGMSARDLDRMYRESMGGDAFNLPQQFQDPNTYNSFGY